MTRSAERTIGRDSGGKGTSRRHQARLFFALHREGERVSTEAEFSRGGDATRCGKSIRQGLRRKESGTRRGESCAEGQHQRAMPGGRQCCGRGARMTDGAELE